MNPMTKFLSLSSLIILSCFCHQVIAQESRVETQAGRCSAIFFMLSETHKDNETPAVDFKHFVNVLKICMSLKEKSAWAMLLEMMELNVVI